MPGAKERFQEKKTKKAALSEMVTIEQPGIMQVRCAGIVPLKVKMQAFLVFKLASLNSAAAI